MPRLATRVVPGPLQTPVSITIQYFNKDRQFMALVPDEYKEEKGDITRALTEFYSAGRVYLGTTGTTEDEALDKMQAFMKAYVEADIKKVRHIYIELDHYLSNSYLHRVPDNNAERITFAFFCGHSLTVGKSVKHYLDLSPNGRSMIWNPESYLILPWSEELQDNCEQTVLNLRGIKAEVDRILATPETALEELTHPMFEHRTIETLHNE